MALSGYQLVCVKKVCLKEVLGGCVQVTGDVPRRPPLTVPAVATLHAAK